MKAVVIQEHGGPDKLRIEEVPEPEYSEDEVVLKVHSAGLNHLDIWVRKGRGGLNLPKPHIPGSDAAGIVVAAGANVTNVTVGDEVILNPGLSCGCCEFCNRGQQSECISFGIVGMSRPGTFAELLAVPSCNVWPKPSHMSFNEAGAFTLSHLTAWRMLMTRAQLKPDQTVLIHGIGGGVALSALQLANLTGAEVIVTSSSDEKLERASQIGAAHTINYRTVEDVAQHVKDITSDRGVDIVIDTVGRHLADRLFSGAPGRQDSLVRCNFRCKSSYESTSVILEPVDDSWFNDGLGRRFASDVQGSNKSKT